MSVRGVNVNCLLYFQMRMSAQSITVYVNITVQTLPDHMCAPVTLAMY